MGTLYSNQERFTTAGANEVVALSFPSRCKIHRLEFYRTDGGAIDIDLLSRNPASENIAIDRIENNGGKVRIWLIQGVELPLYEGDSITVAGSTTAGYNTTHVVTGFGTTYRTPHPTGNLRDQTNYIDTDETYTADATGGTATFALPTAEEPLWAVTQSPLTGTPTADALSHVDGDEIEYVNRDPQGSRNIGLNRKLYVRPAGAATYVVNYVTEDLVG